MRVSKTVFLCFNRSKRPIWLLNNFMQFSMKYTTTIRSSRSLMLFEISVLKVCNIHRKKIALESLLSKVASLEACNFIKKRLQHRYFSVNIANFLRKFYFFKENFNRWLLLYFRFIENLMTYINWINWEIDDIYFQYTVKPPYSGRPKWRTCHEKRTRR